MLKKIHGFSSRLLTVKTSKGVNSYNLGAFNSSFGDNEQIVAIAFRYNKAALPSLAYRSINDRPLINVSEVKKGYINLVEDNGSSTNILSNHNLWLMVTESKEQSFYGIFIPPCQVKWTQSNIEFAPSVSFEGTQDLELNVYYITNCQKPIEPNIIFDNGFKYNAVRKKTIQINVKAKEESFAIRSNPLSNCATIVGLRYDEFDFETTEGKTNVSKGSSISPKIPAALGASFLTMRIGSRNLLEDFPLTELRAPYHLGFSYFPIEPTKSHHFNWNQCKINLPNKALTQDNTCYLLTLYYL